MPNPAEFTELLDNTTQTYTASSDGESGVNYCTVASKTNGQSIILPFGGYYTGNTSVSGTLQYGGTVGYYWTRELKGVNDAECFTVGNDKAEVSSLGRRYGASVRAVAQP